MKSLPIANHELYRINDFGQIHSGKTDTILAPRVNPSGYLIVTLDGKQYSVHRLVALHFLPNPYLFDQINHKDGNKINNYCENLEWCSAEQNSNHALKTGLSEGFGHVYTKREMLARAFLSTELVSDLAIEVGNHPNTLNRMLRVQAEKDGLLEKWKKRNSS